jgi:hypothetical protein
LYVRSGLWRGLLPPPFSEQFAVTLFLALRQQKNLRGRDLDQFTPAYALSIRDSALEKRWILKRLKPDRTELAFKI